MQACSSGAARQRLIAGSFSALPVCRLTQHFVGAMTPHQARIDDNYEDGRARADLRQWHHRL
jgi:hypothetical protein